jgi:hypothetical protein
MTSLFITRRCAYVALGLFLAGISSAEAQERSSLQVKEGVLVRLAPDAFAGLYQHPFKHHCDVKDNVLGTAVVGECQTDGNYTLKPLDQENVLLLTVTGKCVTTSTGRNGPATIKSTAITNFTATSRIVLEPDAGKFVASPVEVTGTTDLRTDDLQISIGGIAGRIARTVAQRRIAESHAEAAAIAKERALDRVHDAVTTEIAERLQGINLSYERMQTVLALVAPQLAADSQLVLRDDQFVFCFAAKDAKELSIESWPKLTSGGCEIWIHRSALNAELKDQLHAANQVQNAALEFVSAPDQSGAADESLLEEHGEWFIVRLPLASPRKVASLR